MRIAAMAMAFVASVGVFSASAQSSALLPSLSGVVRRASDLTPLAGVDLWIPSADLHTISDSSGAYKFDRLAAGLVLIQLRHVGYEPRRDSVTVTPDGLVRRDFVLAPQGTMLDTVRTVAAGTKWMSPRLRAFEERRAQGFGRFITDSILRANENESLAQVALQRMPGVRLVNGPLGAQYLASTRKVCAGPVFQKSCTPCYVTIFEDGVLTYMYRDRSVDSSPPPDARRIQNSQLAGVEFYAGGGSMPAEFIHTDSGCGVLMIWTREQ